MKLMAKNLDGDFKREVIPEEPLAKWLNAY